MENEIELLQTISRSASEFVVNYGFQLLGAIIILIIGWLLSRWVNSLILGLCKRLSLDITLSRFFAGLGRSILLIFVVIIALGKFGITITPFVAALGAVIFGSTLALQGPISNYGSGLTIILTRPFVVGDTIRVNNVIGVVEEIKLARTILMNEDGEKILIPNNKIVGEVIHNSFGNLVVEQSITIAYEDDPERAISLIRDVFKNNPDIAKEPQAQVGIQKFGDSGIEIGMRYWVPTKKYFQIMYAANAEIYNALLTAGINIPYPRQMIDIRSPK